MCAQWLVRQIYVGRLAAMGFSPMLLDADIVLFANPFELIRKHLPSYQLYFLGDTSAGWLSINGGTIFIRNASAHGPTVRIWRELERRVFALLNTTAPYPKQLRHKTPAVSSSTGSQQMLCFTIRTCSIVRTCRSASYATQLRSRMPCFAPMRQLLLPHLACCDSIRVVPLGARCPISLTHARWLASVASPASQGTSSAS